MLATLNLDTHRIVKHLESKGFTEEQAEGFIEAIEEINLVGVATKEDIQILKNDSQLLKSDLQLFRDEMTLFKQEVRADMAKQEATMIAHISDSRIELMKFMLLQTVAIIGVTFGLVKLL